MVEAFTNVAIARRNPESPVLITGETGVGKDVIASAIGYHTKSKPFVAVDCAGKLSVLPLQDIQPPYGLKTSYGTLSWTSKIVQSLSFQIATASTANGWARF
jgi:hypothetical protein